MKNGWKQMTMVEVGQKRQKWLNKKGENSLNLLITSFLISKCLSVWGSEFPCFQDSMFPSFQRGSYSSAQLIFMQQISQKVLFSALILLKVIVSNLTSAFVIGVKCTIFGLNICLRVYFDLYAADFPKSIQKYLFKLSTWYDISLNLK